MTDHPRSPDSLRLLVRGAAAMSILLVVAAACTPAPAATGGPDSSAGPATGATPSASPETGGISHPSGATDVLLRVDTTGGFAPVEFLATSAPSFTLYGDGTVVFRDPMAAPPQPLGNVSRSVPFMTVRLDEAGIQALLADALGPGGLGAATGPYMGMGADIPSTIFSINADGVTKDVAVVGLSPELHPQDSAIVTALSKLADRLGTFGAAVPGEVPYQPALYRGVLLSADQPFGPVVAWPWSAITSDDFSGDENELLRTRALTADEVDALGIPDVAGGLTGVSLQQGDQLFTFSLRPLLPDEQA